MPAGRDTLKGAYSASRPPADPEARRVQRRATGFKRDATLDRLSEMRDSDPEEFDRLMTPRLRLALGAYESAREAAEQEGSA